jgi:hypothetical protein
VCSINGQSLRVRVKRCSHVCVQNIWVDYCCPGAAVVPISFSSLCTHICEKTLIWCPSMVMPSLLSSTVPS